MELEQLPEIQKIIHIGKANGEITYDEINDILPEKLTNSDKIDDVFILLSQYGIEIVEDYDLKSVSEKVAANTKQPAINISILGEQKVPKVLIKELQRIGYEVEVQPKTTLNIQDLAIQLMNKGYDLDTLSQLLQRPEMRPAIPKKKRGELGAGAGADDPIRLYLKEIGKISLISGDKEVELAKRIEVGENIIEDAVLRSLRSAVLLKYTTFPKLSKSVLEKTFSKRLRML